MKPERPSVQVRRDPFARHTIMRRIVSDRGGCDWCGSYRKGSGLFEYSVDSDGGRSADIQGAFCSISCMEKYHS
jgi:hypothetical protein